MSKNIFDGAVVSKVSLPKSLSAFFWDRRNWGMKILGEYVSSIHGDEYRSAAQDNDNSDGRLTGIQLTVYAGVKLITYALIEPKKNPDNIILISKVEAQDETHCAYVPVSDEGLESPLGAAMKRAGVESLNLPAVADIVMLEVNNHPKLKTPAIKPLHLKEDVLVGGQPSMHMFHVCNKKSLEVGQRWRAKMIGKPTIVTRKDKPGVMPVIHFNVELLGIAC